MKQIYNIYTPSQQEVTTTSQQTPLEYRYLLQSEIDRLVSLSLPYAVAIHKAKALIAVKYPDLQPPPVVAMPTYTPVVKQWFNPEGFMPAAEVQNNLEGFWGLLKKNEPLAFDIASDCLWRIKNGYANFSQSRLAKRLGCSREYVNRVIRWLCEMRILNKKQRRVKDTCLYQLSTYFKNKQILSRLAVIFPFLFFIAHLQSKPVSVIKPSVAQVTHISNERINIKNTRINLSSKRVPLDSDYAFGSAQDVVGTQKPHKREGPMVERDRNTPKWVSDEYLARKKLEQEADKQYTHQYVLQKGDRREASQHNPHDRSNRPTGFVHASRYLGGGPSAWAEDDHGEGE